MNTQLHPKDKQANYWERSLNCRKCGKRFIVLGNDNDVARLIEAKRDYCDKCLDEIDSLIL